MKLLTTTSAQGSSCVDFNLVLCMPQGTVMVSGLGYGGESLRTSPAPGLFAFSIDVLQGSEMACRKFILGIMKSCILHSFNSVFGALTTLTVSKYLFSHFQAFFLRNKAMHKMFQAVCKSVTRTPSCCFPSPVSHPSFSLSS